MDSWFREIHVLRAWRVYLATGFDFREKNRAFFGSIGARVCCQSLTLPLYYEGKVMKTTFPKNYVYVLRTTKTRHMVSFNEGGGVVEWLRALDLKSGGPWFKSSTSPLSGFVLGSPEFNSSTALCT